MRGDEADQFVFRGALGQRHHLGQGFSGLIRLGWIAHPGLTGRAVVNSGELVSGLGKGLLEAGAFQEEVLVQLADDLLDVRDLDRLAELVLADRPDLTEGGHAVQEGHDEVGRRGQEGRLGGQSQGILDDDHVSALDCGRLGVEGANLRRNRISHH